MESLSEEVWDVVIAGTSLSQSLLALALSKCDVKVLHIDRNDYYGGIDAGLSLEEAQRWADAHKASDETSDSIDSSTSDSKAILGSSRAYTISLKPQIIYAKSRFLPTLVSSQIHTQLEFQAVGSFFVYADGKLQKIPSNREDVFADDTLSVKDKRRLMGLLRYVLEEHEENSEPTSSLEAKLRDQFKIPGNLQCPVQALTLGVDTLANTPFSTALDRLRRHLMSTGYFGPGIAAVMAKYGGNAEIAQVACRAGAVGGFVYLLSHGIKAADVSANPDGLIELELQDGTKVRTKYLAGTADDLPSSVHLRSGKSHQGDATVKVSNRTSIVSNPLKHLFNSATENGPVPAVSIVLVHNGELDLPPIYLQVHSEDTGECPSGRCIIYASTLNHDASDQQRLDTATTNLVHTVNELETASILWSISYTLDHSAPLPSPSSSGQDSSGVTTHSNVTIFPERAHDLAFDDRILDDVKLAWERVLGDRSAEYDFLRFEERKDPNEED